MGVTSYLLTGMILQVEVNISTNPFPTNFPPISPLRQLFRDGRPLRRRASGEAGVHLVSSTPENSHFKPRKFPPRFPSACCLASTLANISRWGFLYFFQIYRIFIHLQIGALTYSQLCSNTRKRNPGNILCVES